MCEKEFRLPKEMNLDNIIRLGIAIKHLIKVLPEYPNDPTVKQIIIDSLKFQLQNNIKEYLR